MALDLSSILAVADGYEARKNSLISSGIRADQAYLATFASGDSVKAFEALRPLVERVRELEKQRGILAQALAREVVCWGCFLGGACPDHDDSRPRLAVTPCAERFVKWAEEIAKKNGE